MTHSELTTAPATPPTTGSVRRLVVPVVVGTGVAVGLGVYGAVHVPAGYAVNLAGFSSGVAAKTWLTTVALGLGVVQVVTAAGMWGRLGLADRSWTSSLHRWSGRLAVLAVLPVVTHCLYALGLDHSGPRVLVHALLGCAFFGAFVTKMLTLTSRTTPGWTLPLLGGVLFAVLTGVWLTSALWFFTTVGMTR